jgi:hypothetical protein
MKDEVTSILKEQADFLKSLTKNALDVELERITLSSKKKYKMATNFNIVAPSLDYYKYTLFTVYHSPEKDFPIAIEWDDRKELFDDFYATCNNKDEFIEKLKSILSDGATVSVIKSLYAKSEKDLLF